VITELLWLVTRVRTDTYHDMQKRMRGTLVPDYSFLFRLLPDYQHHQDTAAVCSSLCAKPMF
jgi:hypothetical protein